MSQTNSFITEIPYREDSTSYVEHLLHLPGCIFFDSGYPLAERGRYDIFSAAPLYTLRYSQGLLTQSGQGGSQALEGKQLTTTLNRLLEEHQAANALHLTSIKEGGIQLPFCGGFAGYFSYDLARAWEQLPGEAASDIDIPEILLGFYPWAAVIDHQLQKAWLSFLPECPIALKEQIYDLLIHQQPKTNNLKFNLINKLEPQINVESYRENIEKIQQYILDGDCYQVNFAQRFSADYSGSPWIAYKTLRKSMAAPYGAYFQFKSIDLAEDSAILSYSPERFIEVHNKSILTQPIKGTIKRHPDPAKDKQNAEKLLASEKNRAENLMIVDLLRNDLGRCCKFGSIKIDKLFELQSVSNVHHLVSSISGTLRDELTTFDLLQAVLPGGSITGTPKLRAMEIIEELEPSRRSIYCGAMAYININGDMDSNIAIRTILCTPGKESTGKVYCWGGGGIVADSEWKQEYEESLIKITALLDGLRSMS